MYSHIALVLHTYTCHMAWVNSSCKVCTLHLPCPGMHYSGADAGGLQSSLTTGLHPSIKSSTYTYIPLYVAGAGAHCIRRWILVTSAEITRSRSIQSSAVVTEVWAFIHHATWVADGIPGHAVHLRVVYSRIAIDKSTKAAMQQAMVNLTTFHVQKCINSWGCGCLWLFSLYTLSQFPLRPSYIAPNISKPHMVGKWLACMQSTTCSATNNLINASFTCVGHTEHTEHA